MKIDFLTTASVLGILGVAIGAFGAHGLHDILAKNERLETFDTAVKYQFYHTFAIALIAILLKQTNGSQLLTIAGYLFLLGIIVFSGTLYVLSITNTKWLGAITPIGGLLFIAGWISLLFYSIK